MFRIANGFSSFIAMGFYKVPLDPKGKSVLSEVISGKEKVSREAQAFIYNVCRKP